MTTNTPLEPAPGRSAARALRGAGLRGVGAVLVLFVAGWVVMALSLNVGCAITYLGRLHFGAWSILLFLASPETLRKVVVLLLLAPAGVLLEASLETGRSGRRRLAQVLAIVACGACAGFAGASVSLFELVECREGIPVAVSGEHELAASEADPAFVAHNNSAGLRGPEVDPLRPSILLVGDSFAYGYGVADDETMGARLEQALGTHQVLNAGMPGDNLEGDLRRARILVQRFRPEALVLVVHPDELHSGSSTSMCAMPSCCRAGTPFYRVSSLPPGDPLSADRNRMALAAVEASAAELDGVLRPEDVRVLVVYLTEDDAFGRDVDPRLPAAWARTSARLRRAEHYFDPNRSSHLNPAGNAQVARRMAEALTMRVLVGPQNHAENSMLLPYADGLKAY